MKVWVWCVLVVGLVGFGCKQVEESPPAKPSAASARTYPMEPPASKGEAKGEAKAREVPLGKQAVTLEFPATRARHIKEGDEIDLFVTFNPKAYQGTRAFERALEGMVASYRSEVMSSACDEHVCALTMLMERHHKMGVLAMYASPGHVFHPWVRLEGSKPSERVDPTTLKSVLMDLELTQELFDARRSAEVTRRVVVEVDNSPLAASLIRGGVVGEFVGTFALDNTPGQVTPGDDTLEASMAAITLLQRVPVERARVEGERVVLELVVPVDVAKMLALSRYGAERIDFSLQNEAEEVAEVIKLSVKEFIMEHELWTQTLRPRRRKTPSHDNDDAFQHQRWRGGRR